MDAALTCLSLFAYWLVTGYAITSRLLPRRHAIPNLLLAPTVGMAVTELVLFAALRLGATVNAAAVPVALGVLLAACASHLISRPPVPVRRFAPFLVVVLVAYLLNGWPQLWHGLEWLGFASDDMSNYCMLASGYGDRGVAITPADQEASAAGRDYTQLIRTGFVGMHCRLGAELSLGALCAATGCPPVELCMAFGLAMHLALVCATGFLAHRYRRGRRVALGACAFMAVSAPSAFGILDQMLGQIGGLALLCGCVGVMGRPARRLPALGLARRTLMSGVLMAGLLLHYPEVIPFLAATMAGLAGVGLVRGRPEWRRSAAAVAAVAIGVALLGSFGVGAVRFLVSQVLVAQKDNVLHFYHQVYNTGHGVLLFWGARTRVNTILAEDPAGLWCWFGIGLGAVALVAYLAAAVVQSWHRRPAWIALGVMLAATGLLFHGRAWFGVHKMVMYIQPFVAIALVAPAVTARRRALRGAAAAFLVAVFAVNVAMQHEYLVDSDSEASRCQLAGASQSGLTSEFRGVAAVPAGRIWVTAENALLSRFLAVPVRGKETVFTTGRIFADVTTGHLLANAAGDGPGRPWSEALYGGTPSWVTDPAPDDYLVSAGPGLSALNHSRYADETSANLIVRPLRAVHNHLALREGGRAKLHLGPVPEPLHPDAELAFYGPLHDKQFPGHGRLTYLGRYLSFQIVNPSPKVRVVMAVATGPREWEGRLPAVTVTGANSVPLGFTGRGSGRLVSAPVEPGTDDRARTLRMELDREQWAPNSIRRYGIQVEKMAALCRDLSVVSEEEYAAFRPPAAVAKFPDDLTHPHLEYSGVYELGWVAKEFKARLTAPGAESEVVFRGEVPEVLGGDPGFRTELTVLVDGAVAERRVLGTGEFEVRAPGGSAPGPRWVEYRFSHDQQLPAPDGRRVAAQIRSVGFEPRDEQRSRPPEKLAAFPGDLAHPKLQQSGIFTDGWSAPTFKARLQQTAPNQDAVLRGCVPGFTSMALRTELTLLIDGTEVARKTLAPGDFEIRVPAGAGGAPLRWVECRVSQAQVLPTPDGRTIGVQLKSVGFEPAK